MAIYKAILKYGLSNFKLEILEYCERDKVRAREQYYLDHLEHEYNILPTAGSSLGSRHSEATKAKIGEANRKAWLKKDQISREVVLANLTAGRVLGSAAGATALIFLKNKNNQSCLGDKYRNRGNC